MKKLNYLVLLLLISCNNGDSKESSATTEAPTENITTAGGKYQNAIGKIDAQDFTLTVYEPVKYAEKSGMGRNTQQEGHVSYALPVTLETKAPVDFGYIWSSAKITEQGGATNYFESIKQPAYALNYESEAEIEAFEKATKKGFAGKVNLTGFVMQVPDQIKNFTLHLSNKSNPSQPHKLDFSVK